MFDGEPMVCVTVALPIVAEDLDGAVRASRCNCPIARSLKRHGLVIGVDVGLRAIYAQGLPGYADSTMIPQRDAKQYMARFDTYGIVEPGIVHLDVWIEPEAVIQEVD